MARLTRRPLQRPLWIGEIKWSDRVVENEWEETKNIATLLKKHPKIKDVFITGRTVERQIVVESRKVGICRTAAYCCMVGRNITLSLKDRALAITPEPDEGAE